MIIADEIVEKAQSVANAAAPTDVGFWATKAMIRAALESVLPDLTAAARAEGMEEAAAIVSDLEDANFSKKPVDWVAGVLAAEIAIRSRISSLKSKTTDEAKP